MRGVLDRKQEASLSHERLCECLHYDPESGELTWRISPIWRVPVGSRAGCRHTGLPGRGNYVDIKIDGLIFRAHRLIWFYMTGEWPREQIDHKDGNGWNNRWCNLREATQAQNMANQGVQTNNVLGEKGIYFTPDCRRRRGYYRVKVAQKYIGQFKTLADAKAARDAAGHNVHGEFYREQ